MIYDLLLRNFKVICIAHQILPIFEDCSFFYFKWRNRTLSTLFYHSHDVRTNKVFLKNRTVAIFLHKGLTTIICFLHLFRRIDWDWVMLDTVFILSFDNRITMSFSENRPILFKSDNKIIIELFEKIFRFYLAVFLKSCDFDGLF
jgi:hypothetical protein